MKFYYCIEKGCGDSIKIYYKIVSPNCETPFFFLTTTRKKGNKKVRIIPLLMKNDWPRVTKRLIKVLDPNLYDWKEVDSEEMLGYLRRGNPDDEVRSDLFKIFGYNIFCLTALEYQYFKSRFPNVNRLVSFYRVIKRECRMRGTGYTHREFNGRSIIITPAKIKKALLELFEVDPQEVIFHKDKKKKR